MSERRDKQPKLPNPSRTERDTFEHISGPVSRVLAKAYEKMIEREKKQHVGG